MKVFRSGGRVFRLARGAPAEGSPRGDELDRILADARAAVERLSTREVLADLGYDPTTLDAEEARALVRGLFDARRVHLEELEALDAEGGIPFEPPEPGGPGGEEPPETELEWVEVQIVDDEDNPLAGITYEIELTDGRVRRGATNAAGVIRYERIPGGTCTVRITGLDKDAYEKV